MAWLAVCLIAAGFCSWRSDAPRPSNASQTGTVAQARYVTRSIEDIREGDFVLARDEFGRNLGVKRVSEVYRRVSDHLRILTFRAPDGSEQTLKTTDEHPFWAENRNAWTEAKNVEVGDSFVGPHGDLQTLADTAYEARPEGIPVFNFQVEDHHSYFAALSGSAPILVHNAEYENLVRFGQDPEPAERLATEAAAAAERGFPHGVSTRGTHTPVHGHKNAVKADVEEHFVVEQTGERRNHFTVHLPNPITQAVADLFNRLFTMTE
jgi:hypothetical protein